MFTMGNVIKYCLELLFRLFLSAFVLFLDILVPFENKIYLIICFKNVAAKNSKLRH